MHEYIKMLDEDGSKGSGAFKMTFFIVMIVGLTIFAAVRDMEWSAEYEANQTVASLSK